MRKLFILLLCSLPFLGIGSAIAMDDVPPIKVDLSTVCGGGVKLTRDISLEPLQCYYSSESLLFVSLQNLGDIDIRVENLMTNELFQGEYNSQDVQQYILFIGEETGTYEITCTTSSGDVYSGTLTI